ncbi:protein RETICULATA-RELATED 3, chloroplastic-like [Vombatus ursinus]|uniref:protein RETICULATA-RELATED 3, chloroplastic-like n=1 Tax=Vombatus ursinus TaxID=29139 RepID=UPI000FFD68F3|nr:protein RETICULATA-RELATED 3, chloroplastic-like [Vombatus ursinus]
MWTGSETVSRKTLAGGKTPLLTRVVHRFQPPATRCPIPRMHTAVPLECAMRSPASARPEAGRGKEGRGSEEEGSGARGGGGRGRRGWGAVRGTRCHSHFAPYFQRWNIQLASFPASRLLGANHQAAGEAEPTTGLSYWPGPTKPNS